MGKNNLQAMFKIMLILILTVFCLLFIVIYISMLPPRKEPVETITTEYGDAFEIYNTKNHTYELKDKSGGVLSVFSYYDKNEPIIEPLYNSAEIRCYLFNSQSILYRKKGMDSFRLIASTDGLTENKDIIFIAKKILLKNDRTFIRYMDYFITEYPDEANAILQAVLQEDEFILKKYGWNDKNTDKNAEAHSKIKEMAQEYLASARTGEKG